MSRWYPLLSSDELTYIARTEAPILAWLADQRANWTCGECGEYLCDHDESPYSPLAALQLLDTFLAPHRPSSIIEVALGSPPVPWEERAAECLSCREHWPCGTIREAEQAHELVLLAWSQSRMVQ